MASPIEAAVQTSIGVEPVDAILVRPQQRGVPSSEQNLPVGLHRQRIDFVCVIGVPVEAAVKAPIRIEPTYVTARLPTEVCERSAYQNLPVGLQHNGFHFSVNARRHEVRVQGAIDVEPC